MRNGNQLNAQQVQAFDTKRRTNSQLMLDCYNLGYVIEPVLDLTYGKGAFWRKLPHLAIEANDIDPTKGNVHNDFANYPACPNTYGTVVFDPPYRIGGTLTTPHFDYAYGLTANMNAQHVQTMIEQGTAEATRLANRYALIKVQDHVSSGTLQPLTTWAINAAYKHGAKLVDSLHVIGGRAQPHNRQQKRARHGYSTLLVFKTAKHAQR